MNPDKVKKLVDSDEDEDLQNPDGTPMERLEKLMERKNDLLANLQHIDESLAKLGYNVDSVATKEAKKTLKTGIRIDKKLSFRGKAMAAEYFKRLDEDNDNWLGWEDFRAMRSVGADFISTSTLGGFVHDTEYLTWESWKMHVTDMGIKLDELGRVNCNEFIKYRSLVEMKKPLAVELKAVSMPPLPPMLVLWSFIKVMIADTCSEIPLQRQKDLITKGLTFDDITYILSNVGYTYTRPEFFLNMAYRAQHENLMESLKRKYLKGTYADTDENAYTPQLKQGIISQRAIELTIDQIKYTKVNKLVAWFFSNRPLPDMESGLYHRLLIKKYEIWRSIRKYDRICKLMFSIGYQLRLRRVFDDFKPISKLQTTQIVKSNIDFTLEIVGSGGNVDTGMGFEWGCQKIDHPEAFLTNNKIPKEAGFAVIIEFMLKPEVEKDSDVAENAAHSMLTFIKSHFDAELKRNVQFRGIFCFPTTSEGDGAPVIRLAFCYKRIVSLDAWFESMLLPYNLNDLINGFTGALKTNIALTDILNKDATFTLDTLLSLRLESSLQFRVFPLVNICKRVKLALSSAYTEYMTRDGSEDSNELFRRKLKEYYPHIVKFMEYGERLLNGQKGAKFSFVFKKLSDALSKIGTANHWFGQHFPPFIGSISGFITKTYANWATSFVEEFKAVFDPLRLRMENKCVKEENDEENKNAQFRKGLEIKVEEKEVSKSEAIMDKLKMLGIEMDADDVMAEDAHDPASLIQNAGERLVKNDNTALYGIENITAGIVGLHSLQILCGKFKFNCSCSGLDFMDAIPKLPSLSKIKKQCDERSESVKERANKKRQEERQARMKAREEEEDKKRKAERRKQREAYEAEMA
jgi:hypothetical protein